MTPSLSDLAKGLSEAQKDAILTAQPDADGNPFVRLSHPGFRGLPSKGFILGRSQASRWPGCLGRLTRDGLALQSHLRSKS